MAEIPRAVLSEHFSERLKGRRVRSAVFLTYKFDPGFFEQEILPVFFDVPLSHASSIRLVQLEDVLRDLPGDIAVYYDAHGLVAGDSGSAKLDIRRVPVRHATGIFHAKNVFLLVESEQEDDQGERPQTLLVACLSANLTRAGWWENVEVGHVEEIADGEKTVLKSSIEKLLTTVRRKASSEQSDQRALEDIRRFLRRAKERLQKSVDGRLQSHFYSGNKPLVDFLRETAGALLRGCYLDVISPYFDDADSSAPLEDLISAFEPKETRVFLPRTPAGEAICRNDLHTAVANLPNVHWANLPKDLLQRGRSEDASSRRVHAKVYRFFTQRPKREILFIGSANLTRAAHQAGGNVETGFLVDLIPPRQPEFWLSRDSRQPTGFQNATENDTAASAGGTRLSLRYHWDRSVAECFWDGRDGRDVSPELRLEARSVTIGSIPPLLPQKWWRLTGDISREISEHLLETSLFSVHGEGEMPGLLLVQEEGMSHKPALLLSLSVTDILRYWSLLTPAQRTAFLEAHAADGALDGPGAELLTRVKRESGDESLFDRFAGMFHAFGCLDRAVRGAFEAGEEKQVTYRIFGKKYDSLGSLLDRVETQTPIRDEIENYLIVSCARQLCRELKRDFPDYWSKHGFDAKSLEERFQRLAAIRQLLIQTNGGDFAEFLDWFDRWFLQKARPVVIAS